MTMSLIKTKQHVKQALPSDQEWGVIFIISLKQYGFGNVQLLRNSRKNPFKKAFSAVRQWQENNKTRFALIVSSGKEGQKLEVLKDI